MLLRFVKGRQTVALKRFSKAKRAIKKYIYKYTYQRKKLCEFEDISTKEHFRLFKLFHFVAMIAKACYRP